MRDNMLEYATVYFLLYNNIYLFLFYNITEYVRFHRYHKPCWAHGAGIIRM